MAGRNAIDAIDASGMCAESAMPSVTSRVIDAPSWAAKSTPETSATPAPSPFSVSPMEL